MEQASWGLTEPNRVALEIIGNDDIIARIRACRSASHPRVDENRMNLPSEAPIAFSSIPIAIGRKPSAFPIYEGSRPSTCSRSKPAVGLHRSRRSPVHLLGRGDYATIFLARHPEGKKTRRLQNCFEEVFMFCKVHGLAKVTDASGRLHIEWGPQSCFRFR